MRRGDVVHTPYGWGVVQRLHDDIRSHPCTGHVVGVRGAVVMLDDDDGEPDGSLWFPLSEVELAVEAVEDD